jgi:hypothetical protein
VRHIDMPMTPEKIWRLIREGASSQQPVARMGERL